MLRLATVKGARNNIALTPKFDGFQMWRPFTRRTYFDVIEIALHRAYGQNAGDLTRMPTLIPEMYALARFGTFPTSSFPSTISNTNAVAIASNVRSKLSRIPKER